MVKRLCIICFEDLGIPLAESCARRYDFDEVGLAECSTDPFPRDYEYYLVHLSNVHDEKGEFDPSIFQDLKKLNPKCKIFGFSGALESIKKARPYLDSWTLTGNIQKDLGEFLEKVRKSEAENPET